MKIAADLIADLDTTLAGAQAKEHVLRQLTDLFLAGHDRYGPQTIDLFDDLMSRAARRVTMPGRVQLASRMAGSAVALPSLLRALAHDEFVVAAPILSRSPALAEDDLMGVAVRKGRDHMLAICARPQLSEAVTDVLVARDDEAVSRAAAGNPGARFSPEGYETLLDQCRDDEMLQGLLGERADLPEIHVRDLVTVARDSARRRLSRALGGSEAAAGPVPGRPTRRTKAAALTAVKRLAATGFLDEGQLAAFARENRLDETVAALAHVTGLPSAYVARLFGERDNDLLVVIARSNDWSWDTLTALMRLRDPDLREDHQLWHADEIFRNMHASTARQTIQFVKARYKEPEKPATPARSWIRRG